MEITNNKDSARTLTQLLSLTLASLALTACGGGGGGGGGGGDGGGNTVDGVVLDGPDFNSDQATISSLDDAATMAEASRQGSIQAIFAQDGLSIPLAAEVETLVLAQYALDHAVGLAKAGRTPSGVQSEPVAGDCGGTATAESPSTNSDRLIIDYNRYCTFADDGETELTIDGAADITFSSNSEAYTALFDFTINFEGDDYVNQGELSCDGGTPNVCDYTLNFTGTDSVVYKISNVEVSTDGSSGINVSAQIYEQNQGYVNFTSSNLTQCPEGGFDSGTISLEDTSGPGAVTVTFSACGDYLVEFGSENTMSPQP